MKYFIDTEFIEGFHKPIFGKRRHFIDLISIGIVAEDGREYYAISNEYNYESADEWVRENVITKIYQKQLPPFKQQFMDIKTFHKYIPDGKSNKQIAAEILNFTNPHNANNPHEFYGYFSDYDWVLFCSLFGRMIDLPKGFPMYCIDLKQMMDEKAKTLCIGFGRGYTFENQLNSIKHHSNFPKQDNEHNALDDAKWNKKLYEFLHKL